MFKAILPKATTAIVSLLFAACVCILLHPASAPLAASAAVSALLLVLLLIVIARLDWRPDMRRGRRLLGYAVPALLVPLGCGLSWASFSLTFQGLVQTLNTGGSITLSSPSGIAVDPAGDVYVVDTGNNRIVEVTAQGAASVVTITGLSTALSSPTGIAIDGSGNLYVADTANSRVVEITAAGAGSAISTGSVTLSTPRGVALDQSGDIFIADTGNNRIVEVTSGGSAAALTITVSSGTSTLNSPKGLAVNVSGTLYIADSGNNRIVRVASGSTTGVVQSILGGVTLSNPSAVTVDRIGNIIIADTGNDRIAEIDTSSNGTVLYTDSVTLNGPLGVALDVFGTAYIADTGNSRGVVVDNLVNADLAPGDQTYSINKTAVGFGHVQLGSSSAVTLTLPFTTGISSGLSAVQVLTSGVQSLDFTMGSGTTCNGTTGASSSCSVEVSFLPTAPGLRMGSVVLFDTATPPNAILTVPLYGWSDSPVAALSPNTGTVINSGSLTLSNPYQVALDGAGNIYVGDYTGKNVTKIPAGGGTATLVALGTPGEEAVQNITGVAVDEAGNLFIGDHQNSRILVVTPSGIVSVLSITGLDPALGFPTALALDGAGNLYIADFTNGRIVRVSTLVVAGSTSSGLGEVIGSGSYSFTGSTLTGLTVDSQGNIYVAARTQNNSSIIKVTNAGVASALSFPGLTPAISNPQGVAVDAMGNIYVVDTGNNRIVELTTAGVASAVSISGLPSPPTLGSLLFGVTLDPFGNLYIADWSNNRIVFVNVSGGVLSFVSTQVGLTSSDSPKTATVTNIGDLPLVFSANPAYTVNFSENTGDENLCALGTSVGAGEECDVSVEFTPQSVGSLSAGITLTNNNLNGSSATESVAVSGTGTLAATSTALSASPNPATAGQSVTLTATVSPAPTGSSLGTVSFYDGATLLGSGNLNSSGVATFTTTSLPVGGDSLTAVYSGNTGFATSTSSDYTETINALTSTTTTLTAAPNPANVGQSVTLTATISPAPTGSSLGTVSFYNGDTLLGSGSVNSSGVATMSTTTLPAGADDLTAVYSGDTGFATSTSSIFTETVNATTTTALTAAPNPADIGQSVTLTATVSPAPIPPDRSAPISPGRPASPIREEEASLGTVSFYYGDTLLGSGSVNSSGVATMSTTTLPVGADGLTAVYSGDTGFAASTSSVFTETINATTTTTLTAAPNPANAGQSVALTATISPAPTGSSLGTVSFYNGDTLLGSGSVNSSGVAMMSTTTLPTGADGLTAVYSGNSGFATSTSSAYTETITAAPTTTATTITLAASPNPAVTGATVTFTATISPAPTGTPTGTVNFYNGSTLLGTETVNSSGVATLTSSSLSAGALGITAGYSGNAGFAASTSSALTETVNTSYTVTAPPAPVTATEGGSVAINVTVPPVGGAFDSVVTMSASGLPPGATASFNPPTVTPGSAGAPTVLTIQLAALTAGVADPQGKFPYRQLPFASFALTIGLCGIGFRGKRCPRMLKRAVAFGVLACAAGMLIGCGGGFIGPPTTQPGSYVVTITGTSGSTQASTTVTVVVQ